MELKPELEPGPNARSGLEPALTLTAAIIKTMIRIGIIIEERSRTGWLCADAPPAPSGSLGGTSTGATTLHRY
ncbi:hypothetical protein EVAR_93725_1 [Eumeta japonica]|uniref:Uncharacterized protein n=1 Tax=Eumeta variegata TaxID=151549 RepID=A0A4C1U2R6_EUMVA|nr:hypothetical protein EVAR_93725_1 [Eumeta japonica]